MIILICNIRWKRQCLTVRTSVMMVHTCPFEPGWLKSNLSTMSKQRLGSELKQNSQSFVKPPALFALQALANKAEDLVFHCRFHCSPHKPDQQRCWKRHGGDSHLRWKGVQLDAACCSYTEDSHWMSIWGPTTSRESCACYEKELAIEASDGEKKE